MASKEGAQATELTAFSARRSVMSGWQGLLFFQHTHLFPSVCRLPISRGTKTWAVVELPSLEVFKKVVDMVLCLYRSRHGGVGLTVGLGGLRGLFQP